MRIGNQGIAARAEDVIDRTGFVAAVQQRTIEVSVFIHIAQCEAVRGRHQLTGLHITLEIFRSRPSGNIRIARTIDIHLGLESLESILAGSNQCRHLAVVIRIYRPKLCHELNDRPRLPDQFVIDNLQLLRVNRYPVHSILADMRHLRLQGLEHLHSQPPVNDLLQIREWAPRRDKSRGSHSAQAACGFNQQGSGPLPRRCGSSGASGRASPHNNNIP
ncbi:hypothetical protein D3C73_582510 [compost metagenome]